MFTKDYGNLGGNIEFPSPNLLFMSEPENQQQCNSLMLPEELK